MSIPQHMDPHVEPGAGKFDPDQLEVAPGRQRESVEGWIPELATEQELREALEKAFDYRGDVTVTKKDGTKLEGYIFDRISGSTLASSFVRVLPKDGSSRQKVAYSDISALVFSGRDPAAGKSWEAWVKKYWEKKAADGHGASLHPDALE
ncbi:MAG TPA: hypothetical protein VKD70_17775 [Candidatus Acidoferrum sp.]|nr:hypothetical protein [Candidatus Acidoferrum sp.]